MLLEAQAGIAQISTNVSVTSKDEVRIDQLPLATATVIASAKGRIATESSSEQSRIATVSSSEQEPLGSKRVCVIFAGTKAGVHDEPTARRIIEGRPLKYQKYETEEEAQKAFKSYLGPKSVPGNHYMMAVQHSEKAWEEDERKMVPLGTIPQVLPIIRKNPFSLTQEDWYHSINNIRDVKMKDFSVSKLLPIVKLETCKVNVYQGANPEKVYALFCQGLIDSIYPGKDLRELSHFPQTMVKKIQIYLQKIKVKEEKFLFLKLTSSIPDWDSEGKTLLPYHLIKIGVTSQLPTMPEPYSAEPITPEETIEMRVYLLKKIQKELSYISKESEVKVNYCTNQIMVTSYFTKTISSTDNTRVKEWQDHFADPTNLFISPATRTHFMTSGAVEIKDE